MAEHPCQAAHAAHIDGSNHTPVARPSGNEVVMARYHTAYFKQHMNTK